MKGEIRVDEGGERPKNPAAESIMKALRAGVESLK